MKTAHCGRAVRGAVGKCGWAPGHRGRHTALGFVYPNREPRDDTARLAWLICRARETAVGGARDPKILAEFLVHYGVLCPPFLGMAGL